MKPYFAWLVILGFIIVFIGGFFALRSATVGEPLGITLATTNAERLSPPVVPEGHKEYRSADYHFYVYYPGDIPPQESRDPGFAMTVEFQKEDGDPGFQIYAAPINGTTITEDRFLRDEPSGVRKDTKDVSVDGAAAVAFHGFDPRIGQTYEVWFIKDGLLYEVATYRQLEPWLDQILSTWRFF